MSRAYDGYGYTVNLRTPLWAWVARLVATCVALAMPGCASPEATAFATIDSSRVLVSQSMTAWAAYCKDVEGTPDRISLGTHQMVKQSYDAYRGAALAFVDAEIAWKAGTGPKPDYAVMSGALSKLAGDVLATIEAAKGKQ